MTDLVQRRDRLLGHRVEARKPSSIIASTACRPDLEVRRHLGQVGVADDDVEPSVLLRVGMRLIAGVDDGPFERGLETDLDLEVVGTLADLEAVRSAVLAQAHPDRIGHDLARDEERREVANDVGEWSGRRGVVLMRAVLRRALVVGVVLVQVDRRRSGTSAAQRTASAMIRSPALSQTTTSRGLVHSGEEYSGCA